MINFFASTKAIKTRFDWVRLRTLVALRWLAIAGQSAAVIVASQVLGIGLRFDLCAMVIGASVLYNVIAILMFPQNRLLSERGALLTLLFDLGQLIFLLGLTGGLSNPFAMLLLTPVVIAATALNLRATILLGTAAILGITALLWYSIPLLQADGSQFTVPTLFLYGIWVALLISTGFLAVYAHRVTVETFSMSQALAATQMALDREHRLTALSGVVAALAHELGTPLATIKLVASELVDDLSAHPELLEDARLLSQQAERCGDILHSMGRTGKDDTHLHHAPVETVINEAAEPHQERGKTIMVRIDPRLANQPQPEIPRLPEIIHGLRNLIQNAVDFAYEHVWIDVRWDENDLYIQVGDDGPGYPSDVIGRLGQPFVRQRGHNSVNPDQTVYQGMGLGLFIAKTFLERCGARISFSNGSSSPAQASKALTDPAHRIRPTGAIVKMVWPLHAFEKPRLASSKNPNNPSH